MGSLPPDLRRLLDEIDAADRAGVAIAAATTDPQFYWHPRDGRGWSIAQCLDHLGIINTVYGAAIRKGLDVARARGWKRTRPAAPGFFGALFVKSLEPPVKRRMYAPSQAQPHLSKDRGEIPARVRRGARRHPSDDRRRSRRGRQPRDVRQSFPPVCPREGLNGPVGRVGARPAASVAGGPGAQGAGLSGVTRGFPRRWRSWHTIFTRSPAMPGSPSRRAPDRAACRTSRCSSEVSLPGRSRLSRVPGSSRRCRQRAARTAAGCSTS